MIEVTFYYKQDCESCERALKHLHELQAVHAHHLVMIDVEKDPALNNRYGEFVPMIRVGAFHLKNNFSRQDIEVALISAQERQAQLQQNGKKIETAQQRYALSDSDRTTSFLSKHYMLVINLLVFIYVGLPFLAPVLMRVRLEKPANLIYTAYGPFCHQLGFRSFYLFGEQAFYPRELAGMEHLHSYEEITGEQWIDILKARAFIGGNSETGYPVGYKIALCERCLAIYVFMLLFGIVFVLSGRRIKSTRWYLWFLLGIVPLGLDGVSQLPSLLNVSWLSEINLARESTPVFRVITGGLFGIMTAWYMYPMIEETMQEHRNILSVKKAMTNQIDASFEQQQEKEQNAL